MQNKNALILYLNTWWFRVYQLLTGLSFSLIREHVISKVKENVFFSLSLSFLLITCRESFSFPFFISLFIISMFTETDNVKVLTYH